MVIAVACGSAPPVAPGVPAAPVVATPTAGAAPPAQPPSLAAALDQLRAARASGGATDVAAAEVTAAAADALAAARRLAPDARFAWSLVDDDSSTPDPLQASPDGARWARIGAERVAIHDAASGLPVAQIVSPTAGASTALLDGERIAIADGRELRVVDAHGGAHSLGPHGPTLLVAGPHDQLALIDATDIAVVSVAVASLGARIARATRTGRPVRWAGWHGATLAIDDGDRVELWRATEADLAVAATLPRVDQVALAWDGSRIAYARDATVHFVDGAGVERGSAEIPNAYGKLVALGFAGDAVIAARGFGDPVEIVGDRVEDMQSGRLGPPWAELADRLVAPSGEIVPGVPGGAIAPAIQRPPISAVAWTPRGDRLLAFKVGAVYVASAAGVTAVTSVGDSVERVAFRSTGAAHELWWLDAGYGYSPRAGEIHGEIAMRGLDADGAERRVGASTLLDFTRDGARMAGQATDTQPIEIRDVATNKVVDTIRIRDPFDLANPLPADRGGFAAADPLLVVGGDGHTIAWDLARHAIAWSLAEPLVAMSPDARLVLTIAKRGVRATEVAGKRDLGVLAMPIGRGPALDAAGRDVAAIAFAPDGKLAAIGTQRGTVEIVDLAAWTVRRSIAVHTTDVASVAWRPDGKLIATASRGGLVAVFEPDGTPRATLALRRSPPVDDRGDGWLPAEWLAMFPDGTARGAATGEAAVWVGATPVGVDIGAPPPPTAPASAWTSLFE